MCHRPHSALFRNNLVSTLTSGWNEGCNHNIKEKETKAQRNEKTQQGPYLLTLYTLSMYTGIYSLEKRNGSLIRMLQPFSGVLTSGQLPHSGKTLCNYLSMQKIFLNTAHFKILKDIRLKSCFKTLIFIHFSWLQIFIKTNYFQ